ncbi:MAG: aminotransferase class I/II-fold pyridoxal phosphate-dependent enzyme, partial [Bacteroidales bacterium]|nr:aminotransferase class I/II-fold pyridoxal phosphate-dependent enzyme [Bacteroidales bacterium]
SGMYVNSLLAAKYFKVSQEHIVVGNGAAELIKSITEEYHDKKVGVIYPTFDEYPNRLADENIVGYIVRSDDFRYTADDIMSYYRDKDISILLLVNPDNPSGNFIPKDDVLRIARWCREREVKLLVDESFVDFTEGFPHNSIIDDDILEAYPNLMVMKSISKSYGVPGLRLGILATADTQLIARIKKDVSIWNINSFAEFYLQIYGKYEKDYTKACRDFAAERARFHKLLLSIPYLHVMPSEANYFLCRVRGRFTSRSLADELIRHNIIISDCSRKRHMEGQQIVRLAIRSAAENDRLIDILRRL